MRPGAACARELHDPPRPLNEFERGVIGRVMDLEPAALEKLLERTTVVEDCAGCATIYCRLEDEVTDHRPAPTELIGVDADGMEVFCIVFRDDEGIWGADINRHDGQPWRAMPDLATFRPA